MIRTKDFIDWKVFLANKIDNPILVLDFYIDAGFSFTNAVAIRKMNKTGESVIFDDSLRVPSKYLEFDNLIVNNSVVLHFVRIDPFFYSHTESTERYSLSAKFTPCKIDYYYLEEELSKRLDKRGECSEDTLIRSFMMDYFETYSDLVQREILSFVELSNSFARFVNGSYNLYINHNRIYYRVVQKSAWQETAGHNPLHPSLLKSGVIQKRYEEISKLPDNIKKHLAKGAHYKFLGFYDESFICYYKIVETIFKGKVFPTILAKALFDIDDKKLISTIKNSNQKTMMLYIYQWVMLNTTQEIEVNKKEVINKFLSASDLRNNISHNADESTESKNQLPFIIQLAHSLIESTIYNVKE